MKFGISALLAAVGVAFAGPGSACDASKTAKNCDGAQASATIMTVANTQQARTPAATKNIVETAQAAGTFNTLIAAASAAGLDTVLAGPGPFTVFAPTDEAFAKLPAGTVENLLKPENKDLLASILKYHVVSGTVKAADVVKLKGAETVGKQRVSIAVQSGKVMLDKKTTVVTPDIMASNGVIHVIDSVLMPETKNIPEVAQKAGTFNTLLAAVTTAELASTLNGDGPFTVLAPNDEAFAKLPPGTVENLLRPESREQLVAILTYHVIPGRVFSESVVKLTEAPTVNGKTLPIVVREGTVRIGRANVIATDINAANGVIHVIDTVLIP
jgi:transforming growth factor-beta-induced protein